MISIEEYDKLPNDSIIQSGIISNSPTGYFASRDVNLPLLYYVVYKHEIGVWTIYIHKYSVNTPLESLISYIKSYGDTITSKEYIKRIFDCDEKVFEKYYY